MTNTDTADADAHRAPGRGARPRRLASWCASRSTTTPPPRPCPSIRRKLDDLGVGVPLIGDFHYNGHQLLVEYPEMAAALAKYRINPGNVGAKRHDENFATIVRVALENDKPVRIGVNWGSLDQALLTELMDANARAAGAARLARRDDRGDAPVGAALGRAGRGDRAGATTGSSSAPRSRGVRDLVDVYRLLAARCDYPLHLGLTEAGMGMKGIVASTAGLSHPARGGHRRHHPRLADARARAATAPRRCWSRSRSCSRSACARSLPQVSACPGCGRTTSARSSRRWPSEIQGYLREQMPVWAARYPGVEEMRVAVMGCVVNGPGRVEARRHRHLAAGHVRGAGRARCSSTARCARRCAARGW